MTDNHPITPPSELTDIWKNLPLSDEEIFVIAARWGADTELEACCEYISEQGKWFAAPQFRLSELRAARRALEQLDD